MEMAVTNPALEGGDFKRLRELWLLAALWVPREAKFSQKIFFFVAFTPAQLAQPRGGKGLETHLAI
jgi:hypothetical protein